MHQHEPSGKQKEYSDDHNCLAMTTLFQAWRPGAARSQMCHERPSMSTSFPSIWLPRVSFDAQLGHDRTGRRTFTGKNRNVYRSISMFSRDDIVV